MLSSHSISKVRAYHIAAVGVAFVGAHAAAQTATLCKAASSPFKTPVVELYTSEGCSSCPPADAWVSGLKENVQKGKLVAQAFHVSYWDYIGWLDKFAAPVHTERQKWLNQQNNLRGVYTPQVLLNGTDYKNWRRSAAAQREVYEPAQAPSEVKIEIEQLPTKEVVARVSPQAQVGKWSAYWTLTEDGHNSKVTAGENKGVHLKHDFVVRHFKALGEFSGPQTIKLGTLYANANLARRVNVVVSPAGSAQVLQALSVSCVG